jgi:ubiquinone/menaquinone biosynthesis C-methylase UbiE
MIILLDYVKKTLDETKEFPSWDDYYKENDVEKMPWYEKDLDLDLKEEIKLKNLHSGKFLDLGTGPGTQAMQISNLGFDVTGSDLSNSAIERAKKLYPNTSYIVDNILNSKFLDNAFDYILDRGVFHIFEQEKLPDYLRQIKRILKKNGILFLKCMSVEEKNLEDGKGPFLYSKEQIKEFFENNFEIESIRDSVYYGTIKPLPKSLFVVMKNKKN